MHENREFLNFIYQNAEMGTTTLPRLLETVTEESLRRHLQEQLRDYTEIARQAERLMTEQGGTVKEVGTVQKMGAGMMTAMQTMKDDSPSHVAEMLIKGSNTGLIELRRHLNQYPQADPRITGLAEQLERVEQRNLDSLKPYLR